METLTAESLTLQDLDPWLTPMQAVVWIALRNPLLVCRASLDDRVSKEAAALIPSNLGCTNPTRAGMSLFNLEHFLGLAQRRPVNSVDMALRCLMGALRRGEVNASAEPYRAETGTRSSRVLMSAMEWAAITLADAPGDDRKLVTWRLGEVSQFMTGCVLHEQWQCVLIKADDLLTHFPKLPLARAPAGPDKAPDGHLFIDDAIAAAMSRLHVTEGPATKRFLDALREGIIRTFERRGCRGTETISRADWASAEIDLHLFRKEGHSGLKFPRDHRHLHNVVVAADDFEGWLTVETGALKEGTTPRVEPSVQAKPRRSPGLNHETADMPLVEAAIAGIRLGTYTNATDAGRALARTAVGSGDEGSKAARLAKRIKLRLNHDSEC